MTLPLSQGNELCPHTRLSTSPAVTLLTTSFTANTCPPPPARPSRPPPPPSATAKLAQEIMAAEAAEPEAYTIDSPTCEPASPLAMFEGADGQVSRLVRRVSRAARFGLSLLEYWKPCKFSGMLYAALTR